MGEGGGGYAFYDYGGFIKTPLDLPGASWGPLPRPWWNIQYHRANPLRSHHRRPSLGPCHGGSASRCLSVPPPCGIGSDWN